MWGAGVGGGVRGGTCVGGGEGFVRGVCVCGGEGGWTGRVPGLQGTTCLHPGGILARSASSREWPAALPEPIHAPVAPRLAAEEDRMQPQPAPPVSREAS